MRVFFLRGVLFLYLFVYGASHDLDRLQHLEKVGVVAVDQLFGRCSAGLFGHICFGEKLPVQVFHDRGDFTSEAGVRLVHLFFHVVERFVLGGDLIELF